MVKHAVIRLATSQAELQQIFAFRYTIYVEEMHRRQTYADHKLKIIKDPFDSAAYNLGAWDEDRVVGAVRVNFAREIDFGSYFDLCGMDCVNEFYPGRTSMCTRLMLAPTQRGSNLALRLSVSCYELGLSSDMRYNFIDCNDHLVPFFLRLGYIAHKNKSYHEEYGLVNPMLLDLHDIRHLEGMKSPFAKSFRKWKHDEIRAEASSEEARPSEIERYGAEKLLAER